MRISQVSPFAIKRFFSAYLSGDLKSAKKLRDGTLLIETADDLQSEKLLGMKFFNEFPVTVEPHRTLNSSRGVVSHFDFLHLDADTISEEMASQGVTGCRKITSRRNSEIKSTTSVILTFAMETLPSRVFIGYESVPVRPFIPSPMRCFQCQRFGHIATRCEGKATCPRCGKEKHNGDKCAADACCVNCEGAHAAYSRDCPKMVEERKIIEIKTLEKTTYLEARKKYRILSAQTFSRSFAAVASAPVKKCTISTQTEPEKQKEVSKKINLNNSNNGKKNTPVISPKKSSKKTEKHVQREKTPSPGPSGKGLEPMQEDMNEDLCISDAEIERVRNKGRKSRLKR